LGSRPEITEGKIKLPSFTQIGIGLSPCWGALTTFTSSLLAMLNSSFQLFSQLLLSFEQSAAPLIKRREAQ
jgi:hypothetical protein